MALLNINAHPTDCVIAVNAKKRLVCEASDIGLRPGHPWDQLYDDACDLGIALRSHKTGAVTHWSLKDTVYSPDQEITGWTLTPVTETVRKHPSLAGYELRIIND